ncbi:hypothetical protein BpHYR1_034470 [Brachionus plicatilis]|uniref:Uncharacterized protein n=1 Tax=Brachionus plicatilis TaxID=10195 RepID=A0A3M7Q9Z6_BRAPC|nr:hypothetical protein BpHYR1_034470 [Brachionus plicatilis]
MDLEKLNNLKFNDQMIKKEQRYAEELLDEVRFCIVFKRPKKWLDKDRIVKNDRFPSLKY